MYSESAINTLINRISWGLPQEASFVIELDNSNKTGTSGRNFQAFHQLVTVENVFAAIENTTANAVEFNAILSDIRKQAVLSILPMILDKHEDYNSNVDYSNTIIEKAVLFDDAIGYKVAVLVLELFMSTKRRNLSEINAKLAIGNLKLEVEGFRNERGALVAKGLVQKLDLALQKASKKIFPFSIVVNNASNNW
jgi:hypothetical protein